MTSYDPTIRRCGIYSADGLTGCCRELQHAGPHCAHAADELRGTPGVLRARDRCDGTAHPAADRVVWSRRPGAIENRIELIPPTEETP